MSQCYGIFRFHFAHEQILFLCREAFLPDSYFWLEFPSPGNHSPKPQPKDTLKNCEDGFRVLLMQTGLLSS